MKQIFIIAANTYRLIFRRGTGWGILLAAMGISLFIFSQAQADGVLVHELRLRMRYAAGFSLVFLSISMLFIACLSIRRDIDLKLMHVLTAHPLPRYRIWLGKWFGCLAFSMISVVCISVTIALCIGVLQHQYAGRAPGADKSEDFWRVYRRVAPDIPPLDKLVDEEYARRRRQGELSADVPEWRARSEIRDQVRREEQLVSPNGLRSWGFSIGKQPDEDAKILLEYCFFARDRRRRVGGFWGIEPVDSPGRYSKAVEAFPYTTQRIHLPAKLVLSSGKIRASFMGKESPYLIFSREKGPYILIEHGNLLTNVIRALPFLLLHFGAVIALGLALAVPLTFPVASFACLSMYIIAVSSAFFASVANDLDVGEPSVGKELLQEFLLVGVRLSQGLQMPPVLGPVSEGIAFSVPNLLASWGVDFGILFITLSCLGLFWLSRKEIDRIH